MAWWTRKEVGDQVKEIQSKWEELERKMARGCKHVGENGQSNKWKMWPNKLTALQWFNHISSPGAPIFMIQDV